MAKEIELIKVSYKSFNRNIFISGADKEGKAFVVFDRKKNIYARIYQANDRWFLFYKKLGYRIPIKSFSDAIDIIEKETEHCWKDMKN